MLEPEQELLLMQIVEAVRNVPRNKREPFWAAEPYAKPEHIITHPGFPNGHIRAYTGDFQALLLASLIAPALGGGDYYEVTPRGFSYYQELKQRSGEPLERMQNLVKDYFASPG